MPSIFYGRNAYSRTRGNLPELPVINMFSEASPSDNAGVVMQSRKGLVRAMAVGSGPIRGMFRRDGVTGGKMFVVSGDGFYADGVMLGRIVGDGPVSFAASETEVIIAAGGPLYRTDGATLSRPVFPDGAYVTAVAFLAGYFIALRAGTHQFYWSGVLDATEWDGLSFASAENEPDRLLDVVVVDDILALIGTETIEFWPKSGDPDLPFSPIQGRVFEQGAIASGCAVATDNSFFWIGNDKIIYRNGNVPEAIGDDGIVERCSRSASWAMFLVEDERHKFLCCRFDDSTMVFDITTQQWCEFASWGRANFRGRCALAGPMVGDDTNGEIWTFSGYEDAGGVLERRLRGGLSLSGGSIAINNVRVSINSGQAQDLTGNYIDPQIEMRYSDDYGQTWTEWEADSMGAQGNYRAMPEWRALGVADAPGRLFEWRVTDPVSFRFSGVTINEKHGGRSR